MRPGARNRLLLLGALWGLTLAAVPAYVMADPGRLTGLLILLLASAAASGAVGALVAGRRARRARGGPKVRSWLVSGVGIGAVQGIVGGAVAAVLVWALMAVTISGFTLGGAVEPSVLTSPRVFLGSFFVALSAFLYALAGGLVLGPIFGPLVERVAGGKEENVVR